MLNPSSNWLLNNITRHQVYLEGLKAGYSIHFAPYLRQLERDVKALVLDLQDESLGELNKKRLDAFRRTVQKAIDRNIDPYLKMMDRELGKLEKSQEKAWVFLYQNAPEVKPETKQAEAAPNVVPTKELPTEKEARAWIDEKAEEEDEEKFLPWLLWIPWLGVMKDDFSRKIQNAIIFANANNTPAKDFLKILFGNKKTGEKGLFDSIETAQKWTLGNIIQAISTKTQYGIERILFDRYKWVSVIDGRTSKICRMRNGMIFRYSPDSPIPPAHPNCRSRIVPVSRGNAVTTPTSYYEWLKNQNKRTQAYILGKEKAQMLRDGKLKSSDLLAFRNVRSLTLEQFEAKIKDITD